MTSRERAERWLREWVESEPSSVLRDELAFVIEKEREEARSEIFSDIRKDPVRFGEIVITADQYARNIAAACESARAEEREDCIDIMQSQIALWKDSNNDDESELAIEVLRCARDVIRARGAK